MIFEDQQHTLWVTPSEGTCVLAMTVEMKELKPMYWTITVSLFSVRVALHWTDGTAG